MTSTATENPSPPLPPSPSASSASAAASASPPAIDKSNARVQRMFAAIAARYDRINHLLSLNLDRYWRWRTVRAVPPAAGEPLLDLCTGTGDLALAYDRAARGRTPIVAADFCREMLDVCEAKCRRAGAQSRIGLVETDAQRLPFPDESFQIVSVAFGLRNIHDTDLGLREMARVLRPGGRLAVLEFSMPGNRLLRGIYGWFFRRVLPRVGQLLAGNREQAYNYLPASVEDFPWGEALAERIRQAGLTEVTFRPLTLGVATLYVGVKGRDQGSGVRGQGPR